MSPPYTPGQVWDATSVASGISVDDLIGGGRWHPCVWWRHAAWRVLSEQGWSPGSIASTEGRDHTTISNGIRRADPARAEAIRQELRKHAGKYPQMT